jgi:hypothetical protein
VYLIVTIKVKVNKRSFSLSRARTELALMGGGKVFASPIFFFTPKRTRSRLKSALFNAIRAR